MHAYLLVGSLHPSVFRIKAEGERGKSGERRREGGEGKRERETEIGEVVGTHNSYIFRFNTLPKLSLPRSSVREQS